MYATFQPLLLSLIVFNRRYSILIYVSSVSLISFPFLENYDLKSYEREMLLLKKRYNVYERWSLFHQLGLKYFSLLPTWSYIIYIYIDIFPCRVIQVNKVNLGKKAVQGRM